ncbi:MAG TPA: nicotinate (nicotinamide) nucleotide adenylyltransferase [Sedimentisphaerales bacterium]|nr:nicotinate (nicotinamide) nucleotide adenylyltransferase [Sedimentisphaerales bacterium]
MVKRKIALFGGTFDPVHIGHTTVAAEAAEHIKAEKVFFVCAKRSPLKFLLPKASDEHRLKMLKLAIAGVENFQTSNYELKKTGPGYTLETVRKFRADYGNDVSIHWLAGADTVEELVRWYKINELIDNCTVSVMYRAGFKCPDFRQLTDILGPGRVKKLQQNVIKTSLINISSTQIRNRLAARQDASDMLHPAVTEYIRKHNLYGAGC